MVKKITIDELAVMTNRQFQAIEANMATRDHIKDILEAIDNLGGRIDDVKKSTVNVLDYVRLESRVEVLEERSEKMEAKMRR